MKWAPEEEQVEFNQGIATLMRIHSCLLELDDATIKSDYFKQYRHIRALYKELKPLMNDKERIEFIELKKKADESFDILIQKINGKKKSISRHVINAFDNYEEALRDLIQRKGLGLPKKMDPKFALGSK